MTRIICSSVIRSSQRGDSHGGMYVVDIDSGEFFQILDWDRPDINWEGRGGDRGIRSVRFYNDEMYAIAGNAILVFDREMKLIREFKLSCLFNTHECALDGDLLYVIANLYDAILVLNLKEQKWETSWHFQGGCHKFDPFMSSQLPEAKDLYHLDSVTIQNGMMYYSGEHMTELMKVDLQTGEHAVHHTRIKRSHNAQPYKGGVIYNVARKSTTIFRSYIGDILWEGFTPRYSKEDMIDRVQNEKVAVQGYTRGMCLIDNKIVVGSSPATINVFTMDSSNPIKSIRISKDIRNSICGIAKYEW